MSPKEQSETAFMTNRELIRDIYTRTKKTEDMIGNMIGDVSVLQSQQKSHEKEIDNLKTWRNVNISVSGILSALATAIGFHK